MFVRKLGVLDVEDHHVAQNAVKPGCVRIAVVCAGLNKADVLLSMFW